MSTTPTDPDYLAAYSPTSNGETLARIAAERPDLHRLLAENPATYPELLEWLEGSNDPVVVAAARARRGYSPTPTAPSFMPAPGPAFSAPAPAQWSYPPGMSYPPGIQQQTPPSHRSRRKLPLVIGAGVLAIITAVVLIVSGVFGGGGRLQPANKWADGRHKAWSISSDWGYTSTNASGTLLALIEYDYDADESIITLYDISGDTQKQLWSIEVSDDLYSSHILKDYVVAGTTLLAIDDGEVEKAPWPKRTTNIWAYGDYLLACDDGDCTAYDSNLKELWSKSVDAYYAYNGITIEGRDLRLISSESGRLSVLDLATGETTKVSGAPKDANAWGILPARDGWILRSWDEKSESDIYVIIYPDATAETLDMSFFGWDVGSEWPFAFTPGDSGPTIDDWRVMIADETPRHPSKKQITGTMTLRDGGECDLAFDDGGIATIPHCDFTYTGGPIATSPDGKTIMMNVYGGESMSFFFVTQEGDTIDIGGDQGYATYVRSDLVIYQTERGIQGWMPGKR